MSVYVRDPRTEFMGHSHCRVRTISVGGSAAMANTSEATKNNDRKEGS